MKQLREKGLIVFCVTVLLLLVNSHIHSEDYGKCVICGGAMGFYAWVEEPTCTSGGTAIILCENYDYDTYYEVGPYGHDYVLTDKEDASCTESGTAHYSCRRCGNTYDEKIAALGHAYYEQTSKEATCSEQGTIDHICSRCGDSYVSYVKALGHNYQAKITKEASCTQDGVTTYTCSRCKNSYIKPIPATGHDIEYEEKAATCTQDGYKKGVCKKCHEEETEVIPAKGHDLEDAVTIKEATCTDDGLKEAVCKVCGEKVTETISKTGHKYPEEWTVDKSPGYFSDGSESKTCEICGEKITQVIPKKDMTIPALIISALVLAVGGFIYYLRKMTKHAPDSDDKFTPEFEDKSVLISAKDKDLLAILKARSFLEVSTCEDIELEEKVKEIEPDLIIIDVLSGERLDELIRQTEESLSDLAIGVMTIPEFLKGHKRKLDRLVKDKKILTYLFYGTDATTIMLKMILPILKPDLKSDESLNNIAAVAGLLGIKGIDKVVGAYIAQRDIRETLEEEELGVNEVSTIIGSIASVLGLQEVETVTGLIDDIDSIKEAVNTESGANEIRNAVDGAKDIVDVVSDVVKKK